MFLQDKVDDINEQLRKLENVSDVIIWGAGVHTGKLFEKTDLLSYNIKGVVDVDDKKWGEKYFGFTIQSPEDIVWNNIGALLISVMQKKQMQMITEALRNQFLFHGNIVSLYADNERSAFYQLTDKNRPGIYFVGDYANWDEAYQECAVQGGGYSDESILSTVAQATQKVLAGEAEWERDGCLFYEQKVVYRICAAILKCALQNSNGGVRVLDIGGALGSTYFQNRKYLADVKNLEYIIAEQDNFADYGRRNIENGTLKFIRSTDKYSNYGKFDIVLLSGSLQYISNYEEIISNIVEAGARYIILDRMMVSDRMRICREIVPESICKSSYHVRAFGESDIDHLFEPDYILVEKDAASTPGEVYLADGKADFRYYVFRNKGEQFFTRKFVQECHKFV